MGTRMIHCGDEDTIAFCVYYFESSIVLLDSWGRGSVAFVVTCFDNAALHRLMSHYGGSDTLLSRPALVILSQIVSVHVDLEKKYSVVTNDIVEAANVASHYIGTIKRRIADVVGPRETIGGCRLRLCIILRGAIVGCEDGICVFGSCHAFKALSEERIQLLRAWSGSLKEIERPDSGLAEYDEKCLEELNCYF
ncbi:hypothetical protein Tco_0424228 [Tanacetum coccineum]